MYKVNLTVSAINDLTDIFNYTFSEYGEDQWKKYKSLIDENINKIAKNPKLGHARIDIPKECLAWLVGKHFFIYRVEGNNVLLLRILHERMNFLFQF